MTIIPFPIPEIKSEPISKIEEDAEAVQHCAQALLSVLLDIAPVPPWRETFTIPEERLRFVQQVEDELTLHPDMAREAEPSIQLVRSRTARFGDRFDLPTDMSLHRLRDLLDLGRAQRDATARGAAS